MDILNQFTHDQIALSACGLAVLVAFSMLALFRGGASAPQADANVSSTMSADPSSPSRATRRKTSSTPETAEQRAA
ncbi:MAG TPA: hypothetical protein EYP14_18960 [Planctomycetaceae bacterium]|nr:hypothetical protein [Planctomycetaceae bacterium]